MCIKAVTVLNYYILVFYIKTATMLLHIVTTSEDAKLPQVLSILNLYFGSNEICQYINPIF
jgi:hypothetical protein